MRLYVQPPMSRWQKGRGPCCERDELLAAVAENARQFAAGVPGPTDLPILASGHQSWLYHPGILAKDMAMVQACPRLGAQPLHLVVDQDVHDALKLDLPLAQGKRLAAQRLELAPHQGETPVGMQGPVDPAVVRARLTQAQEQFGAALQADLSPLLAAFTDLPACRTLAQQMTAVLQRLWQPWLGAVPVLFVSDLPAMRCFRAVVQAMLEDAAACVRHYNAAVAEHPGAQIAPLLVEPTRVELPLWLLQWGQPRQRVFADLSDSTPLLVLPSGEPLPGEQAGAMVAPRALLLTAVLRQWCCDLFIHGKGGQLYDQITERWWGGWRGQELAPMATVTADLYLPWKAPLAQEKDLAQALWWQHHLPHNVDRVLGLDGEPVQRKRTLLEHMDDDRDKARRARAFAELHQINDRLLAEHEELVAAGKERLAEVKMGLENRAVAGKRDWCFALYPREEMDRLQRAIKEAAQAAV